MESYYCLAEKFILRAEELCIELCLGLDKPVDLAQVKDHMVNAQNKVSFVQHSDNSLFHTHLKPLRTSLYNSGRLFKNEQ
jgi:hypothetical protein